MSQQTVEEMKQHLAGYLKEAQELRQVKLPGSTAPPEEFYTMLLLVRARLDRMEELLGTAMQAQAWVKSKAAVAADAAQDSWDTISGREEARGARSGNDYEGAQARTARVNLQVLPQRRAAREAQALADLTRYTTDRLRLMYQGLDGVRRDLHRVLSYFPLESNLER